MKFRLLKAIACRNLFLFRLGRGWLLVDGSKVGPSGEVDHLKAQLVAKIYLKFMDLTTIILFLLWPSSTQLSSSLLWLLFAIGHFISFTLKMFLFKMIFRRKFTWNNLLDLLLKGSIALLSMDWSSRLKLGLVNLVTEFWFKMK